MKEALKQAIRGAQEQQNSCPQCGSNQRHTRGTKRRVLLTCFGRVEVPLKRLRCQVCHHLFRPAERCLAEVKGPTSRLSCVSSPPWWVVRGRMKQRRECSNGGVGAQLSDESLRQLTNERGRAVAKEQCEQAEQVLQEAVSMQQIRTQREQSSGVSQPVAADCLQVGLDGGWVPSREQKGGIEGKVAVVASQVEAVGKQGRHRLTKRRYVVTFGPAEEVGMLS